MVLHGVTPRVQGTIMTMTARSVRRSPRTLLAALVAAACLARPVAAAPAPLPDWDAAKKKSQLPDWDAAKKKPQLPDWDAAKKKPKKPKKPKRTNDPLASEPPPEDAPPAEPPPEDAPPADPPPEPPPADPPPVDPPPPAPTAVEGPAEPPAAPVDRGPDREAVRQARAELISGGVLMGVGLGGLGMMTAGLLLKDNAQDAIDDKGASDERDADLKQAETILAAGAVIGSVGTVLGLALVIDGRRDLKAARGGGGEVAHVRVAPGVAGLVLSGRF
jgi:outer membrane biosynthesis protein TonB